LKLTKNWQLSSIVLATIFLGACSSTPVTPEAKPAAPQFVAPMAAAPAAAPVAVPLAKPAAPVAAPIAAYLDPASMLFQQRSIYFDFDQSALKPDASSVLEMHGKYLAAHPNVAIKVQGNTDEKGGTEYNLALGQKRADAVARALKIYGLKDAQLEAVSFGKEKPKAMGHDEAAHAENRRADLVYPAQ